MHNRWVICNSCSIIDFEIACNSVRYFCRQVYQCLLLSPSLQIGEEKKKKNPFAKCGLEEQVTPGAFLSQERDRIYFYLSYLWLVTQILHLSEICYLVVYNYVLVFSFFPSTLRLNYYPKYV